jgi:hypothetical protein
MYSIGLHNEGGRKGKFYLLYLLAYAFLYQYKLYICQAHKPAFRYAAAVSMAA